MCTAASYKTKDHYFGRTLDYEFTYGEEVTVMPRNFPLSFRNLGTLDHHYAIIGMAHIADGYPLFYDGVNEHGLAGAALNFVDYASYQEDDRDKDNIEHFELICWLLAQCKTVADAKELLERINITGDPFSEKLPASQLHWIFADESEAITIECVKEGLRVYQNLAGVLTNNPPFDEQMFHLNNFMHLSTKTPENRFSPRLPLQAYSRGMGGLGLPGDLSSQSRFVRVAFTALNSVSGESEEESVSQFFHILGTVSQTRGCCELEDGKYEISVYTSCCNTAKGIYYYTTYDNRQITAVHMHREDLNASELIRYHMITKQQIHHQN